MSVKRKVITTIIVLIIIAALGFGGWKLWQKQFGTTSNDGEVFVSSVSEINTSTGFLLATNKLPGVVESQKTLNVTYDTEKTISKFYVKEGDIVEKGAKLFSYDVESMKLTLEQGNIENDRTLNEIESKKSQIKELETEKNKAPQDEQLGYTTQIQALNTDISKAEYDIKAKKAELKKIEKSIKNCDVTAEMAGTIKKITDPKSKGAESTEEEMYSGDESTEDANTVVTIMANGDFRVKGTINEQNIGTISVGDTLILRSRIDDAITWTGTVSEISSEAEKSNNNYYYDTGDDQTSSSKYAFYIDLDSTENLMMGQHLVIEPDLGQAKEKTGVWIYSDYIVDLKTEKPFVWIDSNGEIKKSFVTIGEQDLDIGDCEIKTGLKNTDKIAYPSTDIKEGQKTTTEKTDDNSYVDGLSDAEMYEDDYGTDMEDDGMEGMDGEEINLEDYGVFFDDEGNATDAEGNIYSDDELNKILDEIYGTEDGGVSEDTNAEDITQPVAEPEE